MVVAASVGGVIPPGGVVFCCGILRGGVHCSFFLCRGVNGQGCGRDGQGCGGAAMSFVRSPLVTNSVTTSLVAVSLITVLSRRSPWRHAPQRRSLPQLPLMVLRPSPWQARRAIHRCC